MNGTTTVYLSGNISPDPATYEWRKKATDLLSRQSADRRPLFQAPANSIRIIDPTDCFFNFEMRNKLTMQELVAFVAEHQSDVNLLCEKDYNFIVESDITFANLQLVHPDKPLIGTIAELAWAWEHKKIVIAIQGDNWYCKEPFIRRFVNSWVDSVEEGCDLILRHWR